MIFFPCKTSEKKDRREDQEHRSKERENWRVQNTIGRRQNFISIAGIFVSLFAAGGAVWAAVYASKAYIQAKRQADIAQEAGVIANRAWVSVDLANLKFTRDANSSINVSVRVNIANSGNTPALHAGAFISTIFQKERGTSNSEDVERVCLTNPRRVEDILFSKASLSIPTATITTKASVLAWQESQNVEINAPIQWTKLIACSVYKIIGDDKWHYTGVIYTLVNMGKTTGESLEFSPLSFSEDFLTADIGVLRNNGGDSAN